MKLSSIEYINNLIEHRIATTRLSYNSTVYNLKQKYKTNHLEKNLLKDCDRRVLEATKKDYEDALELHNDFLNHEWK